MSATSGALRNSYKSRVIPRGMLRRVLVLLLLVISAAAFQLHVLPKARKPCAGKLCYEQYLDKMRGFINGTNIT